MSKPFLTGRRFRDAKTSAHRAPFRRRVWAPEALEPRRLLAVGYTLTDLGTLPGLTAESSALAISDLGAVVGYSASDTTQRGFYWQNGVLTDIGDLSGGHNQSFAIDINSNGQVAGRSYGTSGDRAIRWEPGTGLTNLGTLAGDDGSLGFGINDLGHVVGLSMGSSRTHAFLWQSGSGIMKDLGDLSGGADYSRANAVNNTGQVVGRSNAATGDRAFLWQSGVGMIDLGDLPGGSDYSAAVAINGIGQVVGESGQSGGTHAFLWANGVGMIDLGDLPGGSDFSAATGINNAGQVVGSSGSENGTHAFLWREGGGMLDLNASGMLDASGDGWTLVSAGDINNLGQIVGYGTNPSGQTRGFLLTPRRPVANAGGPYSIGHNGSLFLDASDSSDPDNDPLSYSWDVNGDGIFTDASGVAPVLSWSQLNALGITGDGTWNVRVRVEDGYGDPVTSASTTLQVTSPFNGDGYLFTSIGDRSKANAAAIQADGKIVMAGSVYDYDSGSYRFALVRYNSDGTLDTDFDGDGYVVTSLGDHAEATTVAIQTDGKIVAGGYAYNAGNFDIALVRYNADGSLDTSFDGDGKLTTSLGLSYEFATALAIQVDGKLVVAGETTLVRYNSDGSLDTGLDGDGRVSVPLFANAIAIQADGKLVVAGSRYNGNDTDFGLVRLNSGGSLDTSFDADGQVFTDLAGDHDEVTGIAIQADGKIIVAGDTRTISNGYYRYDIGVARYNSDGSLDTSFDGDGKVITSVGPNSDFARAVAVQTDGSVIVAGLTDTVSSSDSNVAVIRYNSDGTLDSSFDFDGIATTALGRSSAASALALQPDGKIVIAGQVDGNFARARYRTDGSLDVTELAPIRALSLGGFGFDEKFTTFDLTSDLVAFDLDGDDLTVTWDFDDDGTIEVSYLAEGGVAYGPLLDLLSLGIDDGPKSYPVRVTVSDGATSFSLVTDFYLYNAAPAVSLEFSGPPIVGQTIDLMVNVTDGAADLAAGFTFEVDWNDDGVYEVSHIGASGLVVPHTFSETEVGYRTVRVRVTDKDGGVTVTSLQLLITGGFSKSTDGVLTFWATHGEDHVSFEQLDSNTVRAHIGMLNSVSHSQTLDFSGVTRVATHVADGAPGSNDQFDASGLATIPVNFVARGANALLIGGGVNDVLEIVGGGSIYGGGGNDLIYGGSKSYGGAGNDSLYYAAEMHGEDGNDYIYGDSGEGASSNLIYGDAGNDHIYGDGEEGGQGPGNDTIYGGYGDDYIVADGTEGDCSDYVDGGPGNDTIYGGGGIDELLGGGGIDLTHFTDP